MGTVMTGAVRSELCAFALNVLSDEDLVIRLEKRLAGKMAPDDYAQLLDLVEAVKNAAELANEVLSRWEPPFLGITTEENVANDKAY